MQAWTRRIVDTGELTDALGPHPFGYINYSADGRVMVFVSKSGRLVPASNPPSNGDKIALFDSTHAVSRRIEMRSASRAHWLKAPRFFTPCKVYYGGTVTTLLTGRGHQTARPSPSVARTARCRREQ